MVFRIMAIHPFRLADMYERSIIFSHRCGRLVNAWFAQPPASCGI